MCSFHSITSQTKQKKQERAADALLHCEVTITNENIIGSHIISCNVMSLNSYCDMFLGTKLARVLATFDSHNEIKTILIPNFAKIKRRACDL